MHYRTMVGIGVLILSGLTSCEKKHIYQPTEEITLDNYFDFSTSKTVQVDINYDAKGKTLLEIYGQNPFTVEDGQVVKRTDLIALDKGFTDEEGRYFMKTSFPAAVEEVYIYSPYYHVPTLYTTKINGDKVQANINFESATGLSDLVETKAVGTKASLNTISKYIPLRLSDWDANGKPLATGGESMKVDETLNRYITTYLPEGKKNLNEFTGRPDITIYKEASKVTFYYVGGTTGAQSVFAYYCYPEGATTEEITDAAKHACVIFPHVASYILEPGTAIDLKYINKEGELTGENFPAGTNIGFLVWNNGWSKGDEAGHKFENNVFYSTKVLNSGKYSCLALLKAKDDYGNPHNLVLFEDWPKNGDRDYNDIVFSIKSNPATAIEVPEAPDINEPAAAENVFQGILGFEDNWPMQGDYDMNDVVVKYKSTMKSDDNNNILSITDQFTLVWSGANYKDGFGYQYPFDMDGKEITFANGGTVEGNVVKLFTNAKKELNVEDISADDMIQADPQSKSYTVTVKFNTPMSKSGITPPYNPFITIGGSTNEVHLTDQRPTPGASNVFSGDKADISDGISSWFICKDGYPFAIHMDARQDASILDLDLRTEGVRIDQTYPKFAEWAKTRDPQVKWW